MRYDTIAEIMILEVWPSKLEPLGPQSRRQEAPGAAKMEVGAAKKDAKSGRSCPIGSVVQCELWKRPRTA